MSSAREDAISAMEEIREKKKLLVELTKMRDQLKEITLRVASDPANLRTAADITFTEGVKKRKAEKKKDLDDEIKDITTDLQKAKKVLTESVNECDSITARLQCSQNRAAKRQKDFEASASLVGMEHYSTARPITEVNFRQFNY